jgi:hypothetical protein
MARLPSLELARLGGAGMSALTASFGGKAESPTLQVLAGDGIVIGMLTAV